jgi:hypothetical protein
MHLPGSWIETNGTGKLFRAGTGVGFFDFPLGNATDKKLITLSEINSTAARYEASPASPAIPAALLGAGSLNAIWRIESIGTVNSTIKISNPGGSTDANSKIRKYNGSWSAAIPTSYVPSDYTTIASEILPIMPGEAVYAVLPEAVTLYSRRSGNWNDATVGNAVWSLTSGGASCDCAPMPGDNVIIESGFEVTVVNFGDINGNNITIDGASTLNLGETFGHSIGTLTATGAAGQKIKFIHTTINTVSFPMITTNNFSTATGARVEIRTDMAPLNMPYDFAGASFPTVEITGANGNVVVAGGGNMAINGDIILNGSNFSNSSETNFSALASHTINLNANSATFYDNVYIQENTTVIGTAGNNIQFNANVEVAVSKTFANDCNSMFFNDPATIVGAGVFVNQSVLYWNTSNPLGIPAGTADFHTDTDNVIVFQYGSVNFNADDMYRALVIRSSGVLVNRAGTGGCEVLEFQNANSSLNLNHANPISFTVQNNVEMPDATHLLDFGTGDVVLKINGNLNANNATIRQNAATGYTQVLELKGENNYLANFDNITSSGVSDVIYSRAGNQSVFGSPNYFNLKTTGTGVKTLLDDVNVNSALTLSAGIFELDAFVMSLSNTNYVNQLTILSASSWISTSGMGYFTRIGTPGTGIYRDFPVGSATARNLICLEAPNNASVRYTNTILPLYPSSISSNGMWEIQNSSTASKIKIIQPSGSADNLSKIAYENAGIWTLLPSAYSGTPDYTTTATFGFGTINLIGVTRCTTAVINNPAPATVCEGSPVSFSVSGSTGSSLLYQWQESSDNVSFMNVSGAPYSGENTDALSISPTTSAFNNKYYRCVLTDYCGSGYLSNSAMLTVNPATVITLAPVSSTICENANTSFSVTATGAGLTYQWQESTDGGASWSNLSNGGVYSNVTTPTLNLTTVPTGMNAYQYRCVVSGLCPPAISTAAVLTVNPLPAITLISSDGDNTFCSGTSVTFTATTGYANYDFYVASVSVQNSASNIFTTSTLLNGQDVIVVATSAAGCSNTSAMIVNTVNPLPTVTLGAFSDVCIGAAAFALSGGAPAGGTYSGTGVSAGNFDPATAGAGTHTITYTYTDGFGCTNVANANITVTPPLNAIFNYSSATYCAAASNQLPTFTGVPGTFTAVPAGLSLNAATGEITVNTSLPGTYTVTNTVSGACPTATHNVSVTIEPAFSIICPTDQVSIASVTCDFPLPDFTALVTPNNFCASPTITQLPVPGTLVGLGTTVVTLTGNDFISPPANCTMNFTLTDGMAPTVSCVANQSVAPNFGCNYVHSGSTWDVVAADNCPGAMTYAYTLAGATTGSGTGALSGVVFNQGVTTVTFTAADAGSNVSVPCNFTVTVSGADTEPPLMYFGATSVTNVSFGIGGIAGLIPYSQNFTDPVPVGKIITSIDADVNLATILPEHIRVIVAGKTIGDFYPSMLGTYSVSNTGTFPGYTYGGINTLEVFSYINTLAVISVSLDIHYADACLPPQNVNTDAGACTYTKVGTDWNPTTADNCGTPVVSYSLSGATTGTGTNLNGVVFNLGTTTVTWTTIDAATNSVNCNFDVIVADNIAPTITSCPTDFTYCELQLHAFGRDNRHGYRFIRSYFQSRSNQRRMGNF